MSGEDSEPFVGLGDFLIRHAVADEKSVLSCRKIFIAYRAYISRKKPNLIISMDFTRFCSYLEHLAEKFEYKKTSAGNVLSTLYHIRFRSIKKLQRVKKRKKEQQEKAVKLRDINVNICCKICCGYLVNATTITECLHSFCKSCIVKHFFRSQRCPACDLMIHETTPLAFVRTDVVLQDIVDKLLPGLSQSERNREDEFCKQTGVDPPQVITPKLNPHHKSIQFILEWVGLKHCSLMAEQIYDKFIKVSSQATIGHVSQFVLQKLKNLDADLKPTVHCDIKCGGVTLPPILTLDRIEKHGLDFETKKGWLLLQYDIRPLEEEK